MNLQNIIFNERNKNNYVGLCSLDLRKAFDLVDHNILIRKLQKYKFKRNVIKLVKSYLVQRKHLTFNDNKISKSETLDFGVPQGSVLGPLFFNDLINDIFDLKLNGKVSLYADDITMVCSDKTLLGLECKMNEDLFKIGVWLTENRLILNPEKSSFLLFGSDQELKINFSGNEILNVKK